MAYQDVILADTPVAYWRMASTSGTTEPDLGPNNITLTLPASPNKPTQGATSLLASDTANASMNFDGTDDYASTATSVSALSLTTAVSIECWINADTYPAASGTEQFVAKGNNYRLGYFDTTGRIVFYVLIAGTTSNLIATAANSPDTGQTAHIVATYDGANQIIYVNGAEVIRKALTGNMTTVTTALFTGSLSATSNFFDGRVDEVAIYNYALSATRVSDHYNAGISAGGTIEIATRADGVSTTTSETRINIGLQTQTDGLSTASSTLSISGEFSATANGVSTTSSDIGIQKNIQTSATGVSTISASITRSSALEITANGASTVTSATSIRHGLESNSVGTSTVTGLIVSGDELAANPNGSSSATASLGLSIQVDGTTSGIATVSADVSPQKLFSSIADGTSTVSGNTFLRSAQTVSISGSSAVTGDLEVFVFVGLNATVDGGSTVSSPEIGLTKEIESKIADGFTTIDVSLTKVVGLTATSSGVSSSTAAFYIPQEVPLQVTVNGVSSNDIYLEVTTPPAVMFRTIDAKGRTNVIANLNITLARHYGAFGIVDESKYRAVVTTGQSPVGTITVSDLHLRATVIEVSPYRGVVTIGNPKCSVTTGGINPIGEIDENIKSTAIIPNP